MTVNQQEPREASLAVRVPDPEPEHDRRLLDAVGRPRRPGGRPDPAEPRSHHLRGRGQAGDGG